MKKAIEFDFCFCDDDDMQLHVVISLASARLVLFDIKTINFVHFIEEVVSKFDGVLPVRFSLIVPATKDDIKLYSYEGLYDLTPSHVYPFGVIVKEYIKSVRGGSPTDPLDDERLPDLLVFLSYFLSTGQRQKLGFNLYW